MLCSLIMGYGLDFSQVYMESGFNEAFSIPGYCGICDMSAFRKLGIQISEDP